jgi:hypothetical protein
MTMKIVRDRDRKKEYRLTPISDSQCLLSPSIKHAGYNHESCSNAAFTHAKLVEVSPHGDQRGNDINSTNDQACGKQPSKRLACSMAKQCDGPYKYVDAGMYKSVRILDNF